MRRQVGLAAHEQMAERVILRRQLFDKVHVVIARRQSGTHLLRIAKLGLGGGHILFARGDPFLQCSAGLMQTVQRVFRLIGRPQGLPEFTIQLLLGGHEVAVPFLRLCDLRCQMLGIFGLLRQRPLGDRDLVLQHLQAVLADQLLRRCGAIVIGGKTVPAADLAIAGDDPFAGIERFAVVGVDHADHRQAGAQFLRRFDMVDQAGAGKRGHILAAAKPSAALFAADGRVNILA